MFHKGSYCQLTFESNHLNCFFEKLMGKSFMSFSLACKKNFENNKSPVMNT